MVKILSTNANGNHYYYLLSKVTVLYNVFLCLSSPLKWSIVFITYWKWNQWITHEAETFSLYGLIIVTSVENLKTGFFRAILYYIRV